MAGISLGTAMLGSSAISGIGSLLGGLFGSSQAKKAAHNERIGAALAAGQLQQGFKNSIGHLARGYNASTDELRPYAMGGGAGFAQLLHGLGIADLGTGESAGGVDYGNLIKQFGEEDFKTDPGYQFALSEGQKGIDRRFSARGLRKSGAVMKALTRFNQDTANNQYQNAWSRYGQEQDRKLNALAGLGQSGINSATKLASLHTGYGQDRASLTSKAYADQAGLTQAFFNAGSNQAINQGNIGTSTIGSLANIGQGLLFGSGGLSQVGRQTSNPFLGASQTSKPFLGASYDNSIWTGATPKF